MKPRIAIPLGVAGILAAIGTSIANANGLFAGHPSLAYWFWAASLAMIVIAVAGWLFGSDTSPFHASEPATKSPLPPPPQSPISVHQENKNIQEFNPRLDVHFETDARSARLEREHVRNEHHEKLVMEFLEAHRQPGRAVSFLIEAIAAQISLVEQETADAAERLFRKGRLYRSPIDAKWDFVYWLRDF